MTIDPWAAAIDGAISLLVGVVVLLVLAWFGVDFWVAVMVGSVAAIATVFLTQMLRDFRRLGN